MKEKIKKTLYATLLLSIVWGIVNAFLPKPVDVDIVEIVQGPLQVTVDDDGKTRIKDRYLISAPLAGKLLRLKGQVGDAVEAKKSLLFSIESSSAALLDVRTQSEKRARIKAAKASCEQAISKRKRILAETELAKSEYFRAKELYERGLIPKREYDEKITSFRSYSEECKFAKFSEEIARFELEVAEASLSPPKVEADQDKMRLDIHSPINGKILRVFQESSTVVAAGTNVIELGDPSNLEVIIDVLSSDAVKIQPGNKVLLEHWGGDSLSGIVRVVEPSAFTKVSALGVEEQRVNVIIDFADFPEKRENLGDGYRVEGRIIVWYGDDVIKVPISALFRHESQWAVFVARESIVQLQIVKIGHWGDLNAEIIEGLQPKDLVIIHPSDQVKPGVMIQKRP